MIIEALGVRAGYGEKTVVHGAGLRLEAGKALALLGPNGSGKTTFLKAILGLQPLSGGRVLIDGTDIAAMPRSEIARRIGYVPQAHAAPFPFSVLDVVAMGRLPRIGLFGEPGPGDEARALDALEVFGIRSLAGAAYTELSGGELRLVLIARAFAQEPAFLFLDEPASNLDLANQARVLSALNGAVERGVGVAMTTHTPDHAFLCGADVALMRDGRIVSRGSAAETVTEARLEETYGIPVKLTAAYERRGGTIKTSVPIL